MTAQQYADLERRIQQWIDKWSCDDSWPNIVAGADTVQHMARGAQHVFDACLESQEYGRREGLFD